MSKPPMIEWVEAGKDCSALWRSENGYPPHSKVVVIDDTMSADTAYHLACEGNALLWRGDFQNARQLLQAMGRRITKKPRKKSKTKVSLTEAFHLHRQAQTQRARILGMLLIPFDAEHEILLTRAPDVTDACTEVYGTSKTPYVVALRELLGIIGAHEWRKNGVGIPVINARIYPHYGVFSPVRGEYIELVATAPLPSTKTAFDIGTGTGILAAVLAKRGVEQVIATDQDPRALNCAKSNIKQLGLSKQVEVVEANLFPEGRASLIVCNPPWVPAKPSSPLEYAVYDPNSQMLCGFLNGLKDHLEPNGEGWLILSDFAEHLGLRSHEDFLSIIDTAGLEIIDKMDIEPTHKKVKDQSDPLHKARALEVTSLWRLKVKA